MLSVPMMPRDSFGYDYSQVGVGVVLTRVKVVTATVTARVRARPVNTSSQDSDDDIITTTSYPTMSQQQPASYPTEQPRIVDDYDFFPAVMLIQYTSECVWYIYSCSPTTDIIYEWLVTLFMA